MKKSIIAALLTTIIISSAFTLINVDFSGTYSRNTEQSKGGPGISINSIPTGLAIKQDNKHLSITRTQKYGSGEIVTYTEILNVDGTQSETKIDAATKRQSTIQYAADKQSFTETSTYIDSKGNATQHKTETWTLLNGGKTLEIKLDGKNGNDEYTWTGVFDKK